MEKTAEADCDEKIKMETCSMESPVCEAISYCSDAYDLRFTNETGQTKVKSICDRYKHSKPSTCAESGCKAFLLVELYSCPSGTSSLFFCFYLFGFSYSVKGIDVRLHSFFWNNFLDM